MLNTRTIISCTITTEHTHRVYSNIDTHLMVHDIHVELVASEYERHDPTSSLEQQVKVFLLVHEFCGNVEHVLVMLQGTVAVLCLDDVEDGHLLSFHIIIQLQTRANLSQTIQNNLHQIKHEKWLRSTITWLKSQGNNNVVLTLDDLTLSTVGIPPGNIYVCLLLLRPRYIEYNMEIVVQFPLIFIH